MGTMFQYGYTGGNQAMRAMFWARCEKKTYRPAGELHEILHGQCSIHNLLWNMCLKKCPEEVMAQFEHDISGDKTPKMDWNTLGSAVVPTLSIKHNDQWHTLTRGIKMGPPQGVYANYYSK